jgi:3-deoxy-manno-octulosonate cytidylyltransferase (CMP-KDO synthetase)
VGLYVYTRDCLKLLSGLPPTLLEQGEVLEQLRAIQNGIDIGIAEVDFVSIGVDTPEELEKARQLLV